MSVFAALGEECSSAAHFTTFSSCAVADSIRIPAMAVSSLSNGSAASSLDGSPSPSICVVGAGLAGSMAALLLSQIDSDYRITLIEKRPDLRIGEQQLTEANPFGLMTNPNKRSINLALSYRGISALEKSGLFEAVQPLLIPMKGRAIHSLGGPVGAIGFQPYGHDGQAIYSVPRLDLNAFLLNALADKKNVSLLFDTSLERVSPSGELTVKSKEGGSRKLLFDAVIGADGAFSTVRDSLSKCARLNVNQMFLPAGYKEFTLQPGPDGNFALPRHDSLHIWPRHEKGMMIALPNPDYSFTCTLFVPWDGPFGLDALDKSSDVDIMQYFTVNFPDLVPLIPDLLAQFHSNPSSPLITVKCRPWNIGKLVLMGDAAHAAVPFYGQGMNSGFEDALLFSEIWQETNADIDRTLSLFNERRQPAGHALAELSLGNYIEMSSLTDSIVFRSKKRIESVLHAIMPSIWIPLYTMVSFTRIPYDVARQRAIKQDKILYTTMALSTIAFVAALGVAVVNKKH